MRRGARPAGPYRAILALVALYGLLLQGFVAAATPRVDLATGILCSHESGAAPLPDAPGPCDACCAGLCLVSVLLPGEGSTAPARPAAWQAVAFRSPAAAGGEARPDRPRARDPPLSV